MADFKFPKDDRFADYAALVAPAQVQPTEVPFDDEVSTDFSSLENRKKVEDMYDQDRASEIAIANQRMKDLMDEWKGVKRKKEVENYVGEELKDKVSRKPASKQPEGPTRDDVRKVLAQDPKPELDDADSYDRAYEGRQIEEANKTVQAANAPKDEKKELSDRELLQQARKDLKKGYQKDRDAQLYATIANALGKIGAASGAARAGVKADLSSGFDYKPVSSYAQEAKDSYQRLLKEYDALKKPSSKGKDIYKVGDELVQVKDGQVKKLYEGKGKKADKKTKLQQEKEKLTAKRYSELESQLPEKKSNIKEAKELIDLIEKDELDTGFGSETAGVLGSVFNTKESGYKQRLDSLAERAARAQLKAMGEIRPTDADVEGMKRSLFNLGNKEEVNVRKLKDFIKQQEAGIEEYAQMKKQLKSGKLEDFILNQDKKEDSGLSEAQERGIQKVMERNNVSREKAIEALKKAGKL